VAERLCGQHLRWLTGSISSLQADINYKLRMGFKTAARRKAAKKEHRLKEKWQRMKPQQGMFFLSAPEIDGPEGGEYEH
jgi:hypothetical protein